MEILVYIAIGVAILAITVAFYTMVQVMKLEKTECKDVIQLLGLLKQQCEVNEQQKTFNEVTSQRLDRITETVLYPHETTEDIGNIIDCPEVKTAGQENNKIKEEK